MTAKSKSQVKTSVRRRPAHRHLVCTAPKTATCARCGAKILVALAHGERVRIDAAHISRKGEVVALISGIGTYQWGDTRDQELRRRSTGMISQDWPTMAWVHADHRCGFVWDGDYLESRSQPAPLRYSGAAPPF